MFSTAEPAEKSADGEVHHFEATPTAKESNHVVAMFLSQFTWVELRGLGEAHGLSGISRMPKGNMIALLIRLEVAPTRDHVRHIDDIGQKIANMNMGFQVKLQPNVLTNMASLEAWLSGWEERVDPRRPHAD